MSQLNLANEHSGSNLKKGINHIDGLFNPFKSVSCEEAQRLLQEMSSSAIGNASTTTDDQMDCPEPKGLFNPLNSVSCEEAQKLIKEMSQTASNSEGMESLPCPNAQLEETHPCSLEQQVCQLANLAETQLQHTGAGPMFKIDKIAKLEQPAMLPVEPLTELELHVLRCAVDDAGNADRFEMLYDDFIAFNKSTQKWHFWDGRCWKQDVLGFVKYKAEAAMTYYRNLTRMHRYDDGRDNIKHATNSCNNGKINALLEMLKSRCSVTQDVFDTHDDMLNVANGVIDLKSGMRLPHDKAYMMSQYIDLDYLLGAFEGSRFQSFLESIAGGDLLTLSYIQKMFGYGITGETKEQVMFLLLGTGSNGKTTLLEAVGNVVGKLMLHLPVKVIMDSADRASSPSPELADAVRARMVVTSEPAAEAPLNESKVKLLTGQSTISVRHLFGNPIEYKPSFKILMDTNHRPRIRGKDHAIWRRLKVLPFNQTFRGSQVDKLLPEVLRTVREQQAILEWLVAGAMAYYREGLEDVPSVLGATRAYQEEEDTIQAFLENCTIQHPEAESTATELFDCYSEFCVLNGKQAETQTAFGRSLVSNGYQKKRKNDGIRYLGIDIKRV